MIATWLAAAGWLLAAWVQLRLRARLALAARVGHEVRGPLCAARLALGGLGESARVAAIDLELRRAGRALEELFGGGAEVVGLVDVGAVCRAGAPSWRPLAEAHGARLRVEAESVTVHGDALRIAQACSNLVANAAEHGGGDVRVSVRRGRSALGDLVRIEVADDGPGLPAPVSELVRAARGRRSRRGHGLAIAAAVAERHGGRLTTAPSSGGARLVLELPAAPREPSPQGRLRPLATRPPLRLGAGAGRWRR